MMYQLYNILSKGEQMKRGLLKVYEAVCSKGEDFIKKRMYAHSSSEVKQSCLDEGLDVIKITKTKAMFTNDELREALSVLPEGECIYSEILERCDIFDTEV